jgi:CRISPR-associated protein Csd1
MALKIKRHFDDLKIVHGPMDKNALSLFRLLVCTAAQGKADNIPPNLAGETMRCILEGLPYPQTLLQATIRRIRAEHEITHPRAALIKACINQSTRFKNPNIKEELKMSLDDSNTNIGYRLGRLFAVLEKIQQEANPGINATIRDRFYGAASGTPVAVFGNLMRLKNHHLAKLTSTGRRIYFEKLLGGIIDGVEANTSFPAHLSLEEQGRFAIGYYHQHQDFFLKNKTQITKS